MKDKNLLSIGEFSILSGLSIKSLRYYDRIGILKPIYIDNESSYRYYSRDQVPFADIIYLSIETEIPLKTVQERYIENNEVDLEGFLQYSKKEVDKKIYKLNQGLNNINKFIELNNAKKAYLKNNYYQGKLPLLYLVLIPYKTDLNELRYQNFIEDVFEKFADIFSFYSKKGIYIGGLYGLLKKKTKDKIGQYIFFETSVEDYEKLKNDKNVRLLTLKNKEYNYRLLNERFDISFSSSSNLQLIIKTMDRVLKDNAYQIIDVLD